MEWVCGAFQPALIPDWVAKIGPVLAAAVALFLYRMGRVHAKNDLTARRRRLQIVMRDVVVHAAAWGKDLHAAVLKATDEEPAFNPEYWAVRRRRFHVPRIDRLADLQNELLAIGVNDAEPSVASFIEKCRTYQYEVERYLEDLTEKRVTRGDMHRVASLRAAAFKLTEASSNVLNALLGKV